VLEPEDHKRFNSLTRALPKPISGPVDKLLVMLIRPESGNVVAVRR